MKNLIAGLREYANSSLAPMYMDQAATAIEKLEAENAALKSDALEWQRTHTAQANTIDALKLEHKECVRCLGEALQEATDEHLKNDALKAELAAMRDQKPVSWGWKKSNGVIYDTICADEHDRHEGEYLTPLYEAAGAKL